MAKSDMDPAATPPRRPQPAKERRSFKPAPTTKGSGASADDIEEECDPRQEDLLDEGVEETFPASDPVSVKRIT